VKHRTLRRAHPRIAEVGALTVLYLKLSSPACWKRTPERDGTGGGVKESEISGQLLAGEKRRGGSRGVDRP